MAKANFYFYVLKCKDGSFYAGFTTDVKKRVATHNAGKGAKYTRSHRPVTLLYFESFTTKTQALQKEAWFKKLTRAKKEAYLRDKKIDI
ncbi:GIY-YIG nuclease family protein [Agrilactobacillus yilanensis]|uniref:GIY-YIG nuclease family protein n=1 Tax=Agrilactobacillus yilanensis TaxID=2485997 RepID=A0ABW4J8Z2_9LACO|nr:GIY-YIG nuclease family protein [Agrilactobacillus yilanensis]